MEFTTVYPGSFGEILQGKVKNRDLLLSCPVNLYTEVKIFECNNPLKKKYLKKSAEFLYNILKAWGEEDYYNNIDIEITSQIPYGKGLASSTADLCGVYYALLKMFKKEFNQNELMENCIKIEPTDSIIFKDMTLFDYKKGFYKEAIGSYMNYNILAFEGSKVVNTVEFNNSNLSDLSDVEDLLHVIKEAVEEKNLEKLAFVSTESIIRNQKRLYYDFLQKVLEINKNTSGLGVIGAHSGNVLGIIFDDLEKLNFAKRIAEDLNLAKVYAVQALHSIDVDKVNLTSDKTFK